MVYRYHILVVVYQIILLYAGSADKASELSPKTAARNYGNYTTVHGPGCTVILKHVVKCYDLCYCNGDKDSIIPIIYGITCQKIHCQQNSEFAVSVILTMSQSKNQKTFSGEIIGQQNDNFTAQWVEITGWNIDAVRNIQKVEVFIYLTKKRSDPFTLPAHSLYISCNKLNVSQTIFTAGCSG